MFKDSETFPCARSMGTYRFTVFINNTLLWTRKKLYIYMYTRSLCSYTYVCDNNTICGDTFNGTFVLIIFVARKFNNITVEFFFFSIFFPHRLKAVRMSIYIFFFFFFYIRQGIISKGAFVRTHVYIVPDSSGRVSFYAHTTRTKSPIQRYFVVNLKEREKKKRRSRRKKRKKKK